MEKTFSQKKGFMLLMIIMFLLLLFIVLSIFDVNFRNSDSEQREDEMTGFAVHDVYSGFSAAERGLGFNNSSRRVFVNDTVIYRVGYYSVNGSAWRQFNLSGDSYFSRSEWLRGSASYSLPELGSGEHYVIVYSCTYNSSNTSWDCHDNNWQLVVVNNTRNTENSNSSNLSNTSNDFIAGCGCSDGNYYFEEGNVYLLSVPGNTYFVATWGNDSWQGNFTHPWATWQKAFSNVHAGDIAYFRGGVWYKNNQLDYDPSIGRGYVGNETHPIRFFNYPGETPILDFSYHNMTGGSISGVSLSDSDYVHIKGLTIKSVYQIVEKQWVAGFTISNISTLTLENVVSTDNGGSGFFIQNYNTLNLTNCDSYDNIDYTSTGNLGGRADGFNLASGGSDNDTHKITYIDGCRSWNNSDDGFDLATTKQLQVSNTWSFLNGRLDGDGVGFKLSYSNIRDPLLRRIYNSLSINNTHDGFSEVNLNHLTDGPVCEYSNTLIYKSSRGFGSSPGDWNFTDYPTGNSIIRNSVVYDNYGRANLTWLAAEWYNYPTYVSVFNSTWRMYNKSPFSEINPAYNVTDEDFVSLDIYQLMQPRRFDGSLPDITFGHLAEGSDLIDGGMIVEGLHCATEGVHPDENCVEWYGNAPDLGPFEYSGNAINICVPVAELCNCLDDNCDGLIDNDIGAQNASCNISNGTGIQNGSCVSGSWSWGDCILVDCDSGYIPSGNTCVLNCTSHSTSECYEGDVYWYDSCGSKEDIKSNCTSSQTCSNGVCVSNSTLGGPIIINHTTTDISRIPSCWLEQAKNLTMHYAHTSHGQQILSGLTYLEGKNSTYSYAVRVASTEGLPDYETPIALRIYDGTLGGTYATPGLYWDSASGLNYTRIVAATGNYALSMFAWCGQQSSNTVDSVNRYLSVMDGFETEFPDMRFILMTGHTDSTATHDTLVRNNQMVVDYANANDMVLFDFADIESYDPSGIFYSDMDGYSCVWCQSWCDSYPLECDDMMSLGCAHSEGPVCVQKAKAFWWMMARLAGWDGVSADCS